MLPLHAQGYRNGLSASPGFLQIRQTSPSSSSSNKLNLVLALSPPPPPLLFSPGEEPIEDAEDSKGKSLSASAAVSGPISIESVDEPVDRLSLSLRVGGDLWILGSCVGINVSERAVCEFCENWGNGSVERCARQTTDFFKWSFFSLR